MKINLIYPKIPENKDKFHTRCIAFEKYDGTNFHWYWNETNGWSKFGTRRTQFDFNDDGIKEFVETHSQLKNAPSIFNRDLKDKLTSIFSKYYYSEFTIFTEFYGPNSFAGAHSEEDEKNNTQQLVIIDAMFGSIMLGPEEFINIFADPVLQLPTARVIYKGKYNGQFTQDVYNGHYKLNEGVVCKEIVKENPFMTKIKTKEYLKRLRGR